MYSVLKLYVQKMRFQIAIFIYKDEDENVKVSIFVLLNDFCLIILKQELICYKIELVICDRTK